MIVQTPVSGITTWRSIRRAVLPLCSAIEKKQGRIHGNPVADGWAGAVMQKSLGIKQGQIHGYRSRLWVGRGSNAKTAWNSETLPPDRHGGVVCLR